LIDGYERANEWKNKSVKHDLYTNINPLIAYLSTNDLADLISELSLMNKSNEWKRISQSIVSLSHVRNAVMHNQMIDDQSLIKLYDLQAEIYDALSN
jgi:hypothetical protein